MGRGTLRGGASGPVNVHCETSARILRVKGNACGLAYSVWSVSAPIANDVKPREKISGKLVLTGCGLTVKAIVTPWGKRSLKLNRRP